MLRLYRRSASFVLKIKYAYMKTSTIGARAAAGLATVALMATAVPAFADTASTTASTTPSTYNVSCTQAAVAAHEDAGIAALNTYNAAVAAALAVRKTDMVAAWAQLDFTARIAALKAAYEKYNASIKVARTNLQTARKNADTTFKTAMTACGVTAGDLNGRTKAERKQANHMKKKGWNWFGFHFGVGHEDK
jgi:hypothetical protein